MGFGKIIGKVASKTISKCVDTKGIAQQVAGHVDIPGVINKIPGMNNPKFEPLKNDIQNLMNSNITQGTNNEITSMLSQVNDPEMDLSVLDKMDSGFDNTNSSVDSGYSEGQEKADKSKGQNKVTSTMETKIKEISEQSGTQIEMPKFDLNIENLDLGGQSNE